MNILDIGIPLGSRRWGGWLDHSDYDRAVLKTEIEPIMRDLQIPYKKITRSGYNALGNEYHMYVHENGKKINFIVYDSELSFMIAKLAIEQVDIVASTVLNLEMATDKNFRCQIVEAAFMATRKIIEHKLKNLSFTDIYNKFDLACSPQSVNDILEVYYDKPKVSISIAGVEELAW